MHFCICRTEPHLPDMPIVYASDAFLELTGYARNEVLGRNCRFLSGVETNSSVLQKITESIQTEQACTVRILNYRKNKSTFWNLLHISPVRNATGKDGLPLPALSCCQKGSHVTLRDL
ncbi:protein TWIN LOV 1-like [Manihot esculenta]|uniref:Uncharacterized protein n=2 Tax=Manihot esculenta TaxID=3983 RepID=A0ACB7IFU7_MANES|nr:protein TWIN LOV 1-like [Manihot esculenta]KAG8663246.1 hypothetical protein MANES_01G191150v8 [Manihot esculenta]